MENVINDSTPIAMLTVRDLREILTVKNQSMEPQKPEPPKYVYGLKGIRDLFNVSHVTAHRYKETFLKPSVTQNGRKILVDVEKALQLFSHNQNKNGGSHNE